MGSRPVIWEANLTDSQPATLTPADVERFDRDGYLMVRQAFSPDDARAMETRWWSELEGTHGLRRDDRSSWRPIRGDLKAAKRDPVLAKILTERVRGVFDGLLGEAAWSPPRDWGRTIVTFPEPGAWEVPTRLWPSATRPSCTAPPRTGARGRGSCGSSSSSSRTRVVSGSG